MKTLTLAILFAWFSFFALPLAAADWPQFRGPQRTGCSAETGLLKIWPKAGPALVWTCNQAGEGYSAPAVVGERLYLMGARDGAEHLLALDVSTGKEVWARKIGPTFTWKGNTWNAGPSATPTVDGARLYALGGQGELVCIGTDGKEIWRKNLPKDLGAEVNPVGGGPEKLGWGFTWSPLVDGDRLICVPGGPGGLLAALDKKTGSVLWRSKQLAEQATYSSPIAVDIGGVRQFIEMTYTGVAGFAAKDGQLLWHYTRNPPYTDCVIPTPVFHDNHVYTTVGFGFGCDLVKLAPTGQQLTAEKIYSNKNMVNQNGGVVLVNGYIYGSSDNKGWVCHDFKTGKIAWSEKQKLRKGSLLYADGHLYCYGEDEGTVVLLEANPKAWTEKGRFAIPQKSLLNKPSGRIWSHPVLANGKLYLRDQELLFCFDVAEKK